MKLRLITLAIAGLLYSQAQADTTPPATATLATAPAASAAATVLKTEDDKVSYAIGMDLGHSFKTYGFTLNPAVLAQGITDASTDAKPLMTPQEMQTALTNLKKQAAAKQAAKLKQLAAANKQASEKFLAANKTKPGVVTLTDGLQYRVITPGKGDSPSDKDMVTVNYAASFISGKEFQSTYQTGKPVSFPVGEVIPGWREALKLMKPGATWEVVIPPNLAYGETGTGPIGPNETLVFKINLIAVKKS